MKWADLPEKVEKKKTPKTIEKHLLLLCAPPYCVCIVLPCFVRRPVLIKPQSDSHIKGDIHNRYNRQLLLLCVQSSFYYFSFCSKEAVPPIRFILNLIDAEIGRCVNQFLPCVLFTESGKWKIHKVPYGWSSFSCCNSAGRRKIFIPPKQIRKQQNLFSQFCDGCPKEKKKPTNIIYKRRQKEENKYKYTSQCYSLYYGGV